MKFLCSVLLLFLTVSATQGQKNDEVLATANGLTFNTNSLAENVRKNYLGREAAVAAERKRLVEKQIRDILIETEAKAQNTTQEALTASELKKVAAPTAVEIKTVFDANRAAFGDQTLEQVRSQIVAFLRRNAEQKSIGDLAERLKSKHKFAAGKDINAANLQAADVIFSISGKSMTAGEFDERNKAHFYDVRAEILTQTKMDLDNTIFSMLVEQEAKSRNIDAGDLIATEVTNKLRDFTDEERADLENALKKRLYEKFAVRITIAEPAPVAHKVSADDDPVFGKATAPVTVIMFSDFQCSACAATHPVLKKVLADYGDRARLVVRDFPLESVHENAFSAALAANAANKQGKFFEYIEVLYRNQENLDAASLKNYAAELGLNVKQFELDLSDEKAAAEVRKDMAEAMNLGARGTPTIFVNGLKLNRLSIEAFKGAIDRALTAAASK